MSKDDIISTLRLCAQKSDDFEECRSGQHDCPFGGTSVIDCTNRMNRAAADMIEILKEQLEAAIAGQETLQKALTESRRREQTFIEFAICSARDYMEGDKMYIYLSDLKQTTGYNAYVVDAKQAGARHLSFVQWLQGPQKAGDRP